MTTVSKCLLEAKYAANSQTTEYTAPTGTRTIIDKFTAYNEEVTATSLAVNLVASGGSASAANLVFTKTLAAGEMYTLPEVVGHVLNPGDFISAIAGAATAVVIRVSGREVTN